MHSRNFLYLSLFFGVVFVLLPSSVDAAVPTFSSTCVESDCSVPYQTDITPGTVNITFNTQVNADCRRSSSDSSWSSMFFNCSGGQGTRFHDCTAPFTSWGVGTFDQHFSCRDIVTLEENNLFNNLSVTFTVVDPPTLDTPLAGATFASSGSPPKNSTSIVLDWNEPSSGPPLQYQTEVRKNGTSPADPLINAEFIPNSLTRKTLLNGTLDPAIYWWRIASCSNSLCTQVAWTGWRSFEVEDPPPMGSPPTVTTGGATSVLDTTATLTGSANPNGLSTIAWYRYGRTTTFVCKDGPTDATGIRVPSSGGDDMGSGTLTLVINSEDISGLSPSTSYSYCAIANNSAGTRLGSSRSFTTTSGPAPPDVTTNSAIVLGPNDARLRGSVNPNGFPTDAWFQWGPAGTFSAGCSTARGFGTPSIFMGSGTSASSYNDDVTGLTASTDYEFCAYGTNTNGPDFGSVLPFTTSGLGAPTVSLTANGSSTGITVPSGSSVFLLWTTTGSPTSCTATGPSWSGSKSTSGGSESVTVTTSGTWVITCSNLAGTASDSVSVTISAGPVEICTGGVDEDGDGDIDCADADCAGDPACVAPPVDTDGDGFSDADEVAAGSDPGDIDNVPGSACSPPCPAGQSCTLSTNTCVGGAPPPIVVTFPNPLDADNFPELINTLIDFLFTIAVIVAPILLVVAGIIFMTAAGDPSRVATARRMLLWTIIGFGIILISKGLVEVLRGILGL